MKVGEVMKKERERKKLTIDDVARRLGLSPDQYEEIEAGRSPAEEWGPKLALIAIKLQTPTSRLIATSGQPKDANKTKGQCGKLITSRREIRMLSLKDLAAKIEVESSEMDLIESGESPLENWAPLLLTFAKVIDQPIFNLFYPCGLPLNELTDYP